MAKRNDQTDAQEAADEDERYELGGYTSAEFDAEFGRSRYSGFSHVAVRLLTIAVIYGVLARGIVQYRLTAAFLLLPFAVEYIVVMWLGLFMSRFVVDCKAFARSAGRPVLTVFWTLLIGALFLIVLIWDSESQRPEFDLLTIRAELSWQLISASGLGWIIAAVAGMPFITSLSDVRRWRREKGVFVWTSITDLGFRVAMLLVLGFVGIFAFAFFSDVLDGWLFATPRHLAWVVFGFLLSVDVAALALGVAMHREVRHEQTAVDGKKTKRR